MDFYFQRLLSGAVALAVFLIVLGITVVVGGDFVLGLTWGIILGTVASIFAYFAINWKWG